MIIRFNRGKIIAISSLVALILSLACVMLVYATTESESVGDKAYIKWVELNVSEKAYREAMQLDIDSYEKLYHISWIDTLSYLACKNGNNFKNYKSSDLTKMIETLGDSYTIDDLMKDNEYYSYYKQAFSAALGGLLGEYQKQAPDGNGGTKIKQGYGLVAYSPIAEGFYYNHYDDFGNGRSYGYNRKHLGNDLLGSLGTPIVAVEGGTVECIGWNQYGGWRLGIRSFDGKRSYYYAHLRKDTPYHSDIELGTQVKAGQVIGYMGMTGYSTKENVNGMTICHLHFGLQLIFDESQKEGTNQIWLDVYPLVKLLSQNRASVIRDDDTKDYFRKYDIIDTRYPENLQHFYELKVTEN